MLLYKNVNISDLNSILENGILSIDDLGYSNWEDGKRVTNSTDKVYLFKNIVGKNNSFIQYGTALLEVEVKNAIKVEFCKNDINNGRYDEYICSKVFPEEIKNIYIPKIFKNRIESNIDFSKVIFCEITAEKIHKWESEQVFLPADKDLIELIGKTANFEDTSHFNYMRGISDNKEIIDLYNFNYIINSDNKYKELRFACNMSQSEFSEFTKIPVSTIKKWEQDIRKPTDWVYNLLVVYCQTKRK